MIKSAVLGLLIASFLSADALENSIVPTVERSERVDNLSFEKYAPGQRLEIIDALEHAEEKIRVMSYNMLVNDWDDQMDLVNQWPNRLPRIVAVIQEMQPDVIGVQELNQGQLDQLMEKLGNAYVFCFDGGKQEELDGVLVRQERFKVINVKSWEEEDLTLVQLKDLKTGKKWSVFNTHLSFSKVAKREKQVEFITQKMQELSEEMPVILTGDLNTFPNRVELERLPFYDGDYIHSLFAKKEFSDARAVSLLGHFGPLSTFTNEGEDPTPFKGTGTPGIFLDHIYVSKGVAVLAHAVQPATVDGFFPSDHLPVMIDLILE
jgi:endonuclease/exonuclease/phosphatase family metal-dependent hydrolase